MESRLLKFPSPDEEKVVVRPDEVVKIYYLTNNSNFADARRICILSSKGEEKGVIANNGWKADY